MTVIVAVSDGKRVCMASDSQATNNGAKATLAAGKIVRRESLLFGCGHLAIINAVRYRERFTYPSDTRPLPEWAATDFVPWLRDHLTSCGLMEKCSEGLSLFPSHTLIAHGASFVQVDKNQGVIQFAEPYAATGSGMYDARGVLWHQLHADDVEFMLNRQAADSAICEYAATRAVLAAIANDNGCGPPVRVEWTDP